MENNVMENNVMENVNLDAVKDVVPAAGGHKIGLPGKIAIVGVATLIGVAAVRNVIIPGGKWVINKVKAAAGKAQKKVKTVPATEEVDMETIHENLDI